MSDTQTTDAARALSRQRWGTQRLDRLVDELDRRRDELGPTQLDRLRVLTTDLTTDLTITDSTSREH